MNLRGRLGADRDVGMNNKAEKGVDCERWIKHMSGAIQSRNHYQMDAKRYAVEDTVVRSADLQKVIMLPRMPGNKTAMFTRRMVAFHGTFASVGDKSKNKNKRKTIYVV